MPFLVAKLNTQSLEPPPSIVFARQLPDWLSLSLFPHRLHYPCTKFLSLLCDNWDSLYLSLTLSLSLSCKEPVEPLTLDEVAERCHAPEDVSSPYTHFMNFLNNIFSLLTTS